LYGIAYILSSILMPSLLEALANLLGDKDPVPNKFTIAMGELVRRAREEAGLTQAELADLIYRRRATISDIETGKSEVGTTTLALIAAALNKPITYFLPSNIRAKLEPHDLDTEEQELIIQFRKIADEKLRRLAIRQVKLLADTDIQDFREAQAEGFSSQPSRK